MKKFVLFITMLFLSITSNAYDIAVENADGKTIYYNYTNNGQELEVTNGNAPYSGVVNIPETVTFMNRTRRVTSIRFSTSYSRDITSASIPCSITYIGEGAFQDCSRLTSVHISDVAAWCKIIFEKPYTSNPLAHAHHLYMNGEEIQDLVIPNDVTSITAGTFYGCFGLTSATIPEGVSEIGESAFCECRNLKSVSIPSSVKSIGKHAFNFVGLTAVHITDIAAWCEIDFVDYYYWSNPLYYAHHLYMNGIEVKDLVIPDGVTSIGNFAFGGCSGLTSVTIPKSITSIGAVAFDGCDLPTVVSLIDNPFVISSSTFTQNTLKNATLYVPEGTIEKYKAIGGWKDFSFIEEGTGPNCSSGETPETKKCSTPTISFKNGKLTFYCDTEGAVCQSTITDADIGSYSSNEVQLGMTYHISVYAMKAGYENSNIVTMDIKLSDSGASSGMKGDVNGDGVVNAADIVQTVNIIMEEKMK